MVFIETPVFTKCIIDLLSDEHYHNLQKALIVNPDLGDIIPGSGGLRKIRWGLEGRGKRGGVRVIYYWKVNAEQIYFIFAYPKNVQENLTAVQLKSMRKLIFEELKYEERII